MTGQACIHFIGRGQPPNCCPWPQRATMFIGPLLQRSTKTTPPDLSEMYVETLALHNNIADGWAGTVNHDSLDGLLSLAKFEVVLQDWHFNNTMPTCSHVSALVKVSFVELDLLRIAYGLLRLEISRKYKSNTILEMAFSRKINAKKGHYLK